MYCVYFLHRLGLCIASDIQVRKKGKKCALNVWKSVTV